MSSPRSVDDVLATVDVCRSHGAPIFARGCEGREGPGLPGAAWHTYAIGALIGAFTERVWGAGAIAMPLALVLSVSVTACEPGLGPS